MFESVAEAVGSLSLAVADREPDALLAGIAEAQRVINMLTAAQLERLGSLEAAVGDRYADMTPLNR